MYSPYNNNNIVLFGGRARGQFNGCGGGQWNGQKDRAVIIQTHLLKRARTHTHPFALCSRANDDDDDNSRGAETEQQELQR